MFNTYIGKEVEGFDSTVDLNYACEFLVDTVIDKRYTRPNDNHLHLQLSEFEKNMLQFIIGEGQ